MAFVAALAVRHGGVIVREPTMTHLIERIARHIEREARSADPGVLAANIETLAAANLGRGTWDVIPGNFSVAP